MDYIDKLKHDTNNNSDITYRNIKINDKIITLIYSDSLTSSTSISDFIIRSLNSDKLTTITLQNIYNNITNFKVIEGNTYQQLSNYLNNGFTILIIQNDQNFLALETKSNENRSISVPNTEQTIRGSKDAFVENYQTKNKK